MDLFLPGHRDEGEGEGDHHADHKHGVEHGQHDQNLTEGHLGEHDLKINALCLCLTFISRPCDLRTMMEAELPRNPKVETIGRRIPEIQNLIFQSLLRQ